MKINRGILGILIGILIILSSGIFVFAQIPINTVILEDEAYDINYIGLNEDAKSKVRDALNNDIANDIFYKLSDLSIVNFETFEEYEFDKVKTIKYYDEEGNTRDEKLGDYIEIIRAESVNSAEILLKFNKNIDITNLMRDGKINLDDYIINIKQKMYDGYDKSLEVIGFKKVDGCDNELIVVFDLVNIDNWPSNYRTTVVEFIDKSSGEYIKSTAEFNMIDNTSPELINIYSDCEKEIKLEFSEPILNNYDISSTLYKYSALNKANYELDGVSVDKIENSVIKIGGFNPETGEDLRNIVTIVFDEYIIPKGNHFMKVRNVGDYGISYESTNIMGTTIMKFTKEESFNYDMNFSWSDDSPEQFVVEFDDIVNLDEAEFKIIANNNGIDVMELKGSDFDVNVLDEGKRYLIELNEDWTRIYNTENTNNYYYNYVYSLYVENAKDLNDRYIKSNKEESNIKKASNVITLKEDKEEPMISFPYMITSKNGEDESYEGIENVEKELGLADSGAIIIKFSEPVQLRRLYKNEYQVFNQTPTGSYGRVLTPSQQQGYVVPLSEWKYSKVEDENGKPIFPVVEVDVILSDTSKFGNIDGLEIQRDYTILANPAEKLTPGTWILVCENITDDIGNINKYHSFCFGVDNK